MINRIAKTFAQAGKDKRACFISYVCAGDPDYETSIEVCRTLVEGGVDILELGVPFSDPLADGVTNQLAAQRSLKAGMTQDKVFELVKTVRSFTDLPIVLYTYYNLVFSRGVEKYAVQLRESGVDALLALDLPPEEAGDLVSACREQEVMNIFLVAPTTPPERMKVIAGCASGFIYYVALEGVTGERENLTYDVESRVAEIRKYTDLPVVVGFGISNPGQVSQLAGMADGVVVGSALVNCIAADASDSQKVISNLADKLQYLRGGQA